MKKIIENPLVPFCLTIIFAFLFFVTLSRVSSMSVSASPAEIITDNSGDIGSEAVWREYEVKRGDSLAAIAGRYFVFPSQIREWNSFTGNTLKPGQILVIKKIEWPSFTCKASWYGPGFHGKTMANGETYDMYRLSVANRDLPLGIKVRVTSLINNESIVVPVLDRGPYTVKNGVYDRDIDLSYAAAKILGAIGPGVIPVKVEPLNL